MQVLKPNEIKSLEQICQLSQKSLMSVMKKLLSKYFTSTIYTQDYLIGVGDIPVAIVAHMDTVFPKSPTDIFYDKQKNVMWSPTGAGFDDRAGVYAIIRLLSKGYKPTIILTTDEERGALGAEKLIKDFPQPTMELKYIIELDRRGSTDCVFYECANLKFEDYIESFGFVTNWGTFSDISVICPAWKIAGVNLSIGYENEHSTSEHLFVGHMLATIQKVEKILNDINNVKPFKYIPDVWAGQRYQWDSLYGISKEDWDSWHNTEQCIYCGYKDVEYNMIPVKSDSSQTTLFVCPECASASENIGWCPCCGEAFFDIDNNGNCEKLCTDCEAKKIVNFNK